MKSATKKRLVLSGLVFLFAVLTYAICIPHTVIAKGPKNNISPGVNNVKTRIINKSYIQGIYKCYNLAREKGSSKKQIAYEISGDDAKWWSSMFPEVSVSKDYGVGLPTGWVEMAGLDQWAASCWNLTAGRSVQGTNVLRGAYDLLDMDLTKNSSASITNFYENMGYEVTKGATQNCIQLYFTTYPMGTGYSERKGTITTNKICFNLESDGDTLTGKLDENYAYDCQSTPACIVENGPGTMLLKVCLATTDATPACAEYSEKNLPIFRRYNSARGADVFAIYGDDQTVLQHFHGEKDIMISVGPGFSFKEDILPAFETFMSYYGSADSADGSFYTGQGDPRSPGSDHDSWYVITNTSIYPNGIGTDSDGIDTSGTSYKISGDDAIPAARSKMLDYLTGVDSKDEDRIALTDSEYVFTYQHYIRDVAEANILCDTDDPPEGTIEIKWFRTVDKRETCYADIRNADFKVYKLIRTTASKVGSTNDPITDSIAENSSLNGWWFSTSLTYISQVIDELNNLNINSLTNVTNEDLLDMADNPNRVPDDDDNYVDPSCYQNAGGIGIALCPIINGGTKFFQGFYKDHIVPFLETNPAILSQNVATGKTAMAADSTLRAWTVFQTFANVAFIGIFLVVIFSQVSGVGLDNYGIKKILPKLIIGAILINLSYFICQIAVDIANIAGRGIEGLFSNIGTISTFKMAQDGMGEVTTGNAAAGIGLFVVIIGLVAAGGWLMLGPAVILPVFLAVISGLIAYIGLFVLLALRSALTIMLVIISPLAFLCYILPNTKTLFNKWLNMLKGVLLAYPICSIMIYGGEAAGRIMLIAMGAQTTNVGFSETLAVGVMSIGPIFLIPSMLKKSMSALGGITDRLSHAARGRATGALNNSGFAQDRRRRQALHRAGLEVGKDGNLQLSRIGRMQDKLGRSRYAKSRYNQRRSSTANEYYSAGINLDYAGADANENLRRLRSAYAEQEDKKKVAAYESNILQKQYGEDGAKINPNSIKDLEDALVDALKHKNTDAARALQNLLKDKGIEGIDATMSAFSRAEDEAKAEDTKNGDTKETDAFYASMQVLGKNSLNNYSEVYGKTNLAMRDMMEGYAKGEKNPISHYTSGFNMGDLSLENVNESSHGMQLLILKRMEKMSDEDKKIIAKRLIKMRGRARRKGLAFDGYQEKLVNYAYKMSRTGLTKKDKDDINATFNSENKFENI